MKIKRLESGWIRLSLSAQEWAQVPPGFCGETIPDEHIFQPEWNREGINQAWSRLAREKVKLAD